MSKVITLKIDGHYIAVSDRVLGATGASAATKLRLIFAASWAPTTKRVFFTDARGVSPVSMLLTATMLVPQESAEDGSEVYEVAVPAEAMSYPGTADITIQGVLDEEGDGTAEQVLQTVSAKFSVMDGGKPTCGLNIKKPTVDELLLIQRELDKIKADIVRASAAADAVEDASEAAREAEMHAATARAMLTVLADSGVGVDVSAIATPVKWYSGEHTALQNKLFVERSSSAAAMVMSLDEDALPDEDPLPSEGGDEGEKPGEDPNPGVPIYPTVYSGLVSGWLSSGTLYLSRNGDTGALSAPFATAGLYLGLDRTTLRYYKITDGVVTATPLDTLSNETIINPANDKIYQTADGTVYVWIGYKYLALDLSSIDGDGVSMLERLLGMQERMSVVDDALEDIEEGAAASTAASAAASTAKLAAEQSASDAAASEAAAKKHSSNASRHVNAAKNYAEAAEISAASAGESATTARQKAEEAAASAQSLAGAVSDAEAAKTAAVSAAEAAEAAKTAASGSAQSAQTALAAIEAKADDVAARAELASQKAAAAWESAEAAASSAMTASQKAEAAAASAQNLVEAVSDAETAKTAAEAAATRAETAAAGVSAVVDGVGEPNGIAQLDATGKVPAAQLPAMDYDAAGAAVGVQRNLDTHAGDAVAHITAAERTKWNGKAAANHTHTSYSNHVENKIVHITSAEREAWNSKADLGADGKVPASQLPAMGLSEADVQSMINAAISGAIEGAY